MRLLFLTPIIFIFSPTIAQVRDRTQLLEDISQIRSEFEVSRKQRELDLKSNPAYSYSRRSRPGSFKKRTNPAQCSPVNGISEKMGEVHNQDGLGWCYAFVAADMISFHAGKKYSPFDLGLQYYTVGDHVRDHHLEAIKKDESATDLEGGNIAAAINVGVRGGLCPASETPHLDTVFSKVAELAESEGVTLDKEFQKKMANHGLKEIMKRVERTLDNNPSSLFALPKRSCEVLKAARLIRPDLTEAELNAALTTADNKLEAFHFLVSQSCEREKPPLEPDWKFTLWGVDKNVKEGEKGYVLMGQLDKILDRKEPVVINYNAAHFMVGEQAHALHSSIIVGREFRNGECKYLVRNSWGPGCGAYGSPYNKPENCRRGHFWMSEEDFHKTVFEIGFAE